NHAGEFFDGAGHGGERLTNLVSDGGGKPAQCGHALLGGNFLLEPAEVGKVLKIEDEAAALVVPGPQRRNADAEIADFAARSLETNLFANRDFAGRFQRTWNPEVQIDVLKALAVHVREAAREDFLSGAIEQKDTTFEIGGEQAAAHGVNDVFGEVLKVEQL